MKLWAILGFAALAPLSAARADLYVIGNKELPIEKLDKKDIAAIYLLKKKYWKVGEAIVPINLPPQSRARNRFTAEIFASTPEKLGSYWDKMLFEGETPPITQKSEQAVILFVERVKGAIGYVETDPPNKKIRILQQFPGP